MIFDDFLALMIKNCLVSSVMILFVLVLREVIGKKSGKAMCVLWGIVALRLLSSFYVYTPISIVNSSWMLESKEAIEYNGPFSANMDLAVEKDILGGVNPSNGSRILSLSESDVFFRVGKYIWLLGMGLVLAFGFVKYYKTKTRLSESLVNDGYMICDSIPTAFVFGIIRPKIFIPSFFDEKYKPSILLHEKTHIVRKDNLKKFVGFVITAIYWYNPLVWIAYNFFERDIEIACDAKAIEQLDKAEISDYIDALLFFSKYKSMVFTYNSLFSGNKLKERIEAIKKSHRNKKGNILTIIGIVIVCFVFFFAKTNSSKGATFYDDYSEEDQIIAFEYYPDGYTGYYYPSLPKMSSWPYGSFQDIYTICQIPEKVLSEMSTDDIVQTVAAYPLWGDVYAYNSKREGYQAIKDRFNGLAELCLREDAYASFKNQSYLIKDKYPVAYYALSEYLLND